MKAAYTKLRKLAVYALCLLLCSCAALSNSQIKAIKAFTTACDSVAVYPSQVVQSMSSMRLARGSYFAASIQTPEEHIEELNALHKASLSDEKYAKEFDATLKVLDTYMRALKSLAHDNRNQALGLQMRNLGRDLDSLIIEYNTWDFTQDLPTGLLKLTGKVLSMASEGYMRNRQANALKAFVIEGDTLVGVCVLSVVSILQSDQMKLLIDNEAKGLEANYLSFLRHQGVSRNPTDDQRYLSLLSQVESIKKIRTQSISACRSVRKAHANLYDQVQKRRKVKEWYSQLEEAYHDCVSLSNTLKNLQKQWKN